MSTPDRLRSPRLPAVVAALEARTPVRGRGFRRSAALTTLVALLASLALGYATRNGWFFLLWWGVAAVLAWIGRLGGWWGPVGRHMADEADKRTDA